MVYRYRARTAAGTVVRGYLRTADLATALHALRSRALFVTSVEQKRVWNSDLRIPRLGRSSGRTRVEFFRSFATLVRAGVPIRRAIQVSIERSSDERQRAILRDVLLEIERGDPLSQAFARRPRGFPALVVAMLAAGEAGGILDDVLDRIAGFLERDDALRKSVSSALAYPATVLFASGALVAFLIVRVMPMFAELFLSFRVELPPSTRFLLWLGDMLAQPLVWCATLAAATATAFAYIRLQRTSTGRIVLDRIRLSLPIAGTLLRKTLLARFSRTLSTLVHSGVELSRALDVVIPVTSSAVYADALSRVAVSLREGEPLTPPLAESNVFDPMLVALVGVGEETGMLDLMLAKAADYFEADVAATIATLGAVIEPILIVLLGIIVGFIVFSVFIPLYSQIIGFNSSFPIIANRKVDATLRVHDGETIVLGGLFEDTTSETISKLPFLSELPILGGFFRNKATSQQRDEVVFLITPHLL